MEATSLQTCPRHIAIIMDGNGRWAQSRHRPRVEGHRRGVSTVRKIVETAVETGIEQLTLYSFSTENWKRPKAEVRFLMLLLKRFLARERKLILKQNIRFRTIGRIDELPPEVIAEIRKTEQDSAANTGMTLCLALNYGSRQEITDAVNRLVAQAVETPQTPLVVTPEMIDQALDTAGMPDPDLVIRTAGEYRLSNFLLWQISYAELWVTQKFWPEFTSEDLITAISEFNQRERRFGGLTQTPAESTLPETESV